MFLYKIPTTLRFPIRWLQTPTLFWLPSSILIIISHTFNQIIIFLFFFIFSILHHNSSLWKFVVSFRLSSTFSNIWGKIPLDSFFFSSVLLTSSFGRKTMSTSSAKIVIKSADMMDEMIEDAKKITSEAFNNAQQNSGKHLLTPILHYTDLRWTKMNNVFCLFSSVERDVAAHIKKEFDSKYGTTWHCVVGKQFGSYVTHESKHFIYFYYNDYAVLLFKT